MLSYVFRITNFQLFVLIATEVSLPQTNENILITITFFRLELSQNGERRKMLESQALSGKVQLHFEGLHDKWKVLRPKLHWQLP